MDKKILLPAALGIIVGAFGASTLLSGYSGFDPNAGAGLGRPSWEGPIFESSKRRVRDPAVRDNVLKNVPAVREYLESLEAMDAEEAHAAAEEIAPMVVCDVALDIVNSIRMQLVAVAPYASEEDINATLDILLISYCQ